jgi:hypothetical protein
VQSVVAPVGCVSVTVPLTEADVKLTTARAETSHAAFVAGPALSFVVSYPGLHTVESVHVGVSL